MISLSGGGAWVTRVSNIAVVTVCSVCGGGTCSSDEESVTSSCSSSSENSSTGSDAVPSVNCNELKTIGGPGVLVAASGVTAAAAVGGGLLASGATTPSGRINVNAPVAMLT